MTRAVEAFPPPPHLLFPQRCTCLNNNHCSFSRVLVGASLLAIPSCWIRQNVLLPDGVICFFPSHTSVTVHNQCCTLARRIPPRYLNTVASLSSTTALAMVAMPVANDPALGDCRRSASLTGDCALREIVRKWEAAFLEAALLRH